MGFSLKRAINKLTSWIKSFVKAIKRMLSDLWALIKKIYVEIRKPLLVAIVIFALLASGGLLAGLALGPFLGAAAGLFAFLGPVASLALIAGSVYLLDPKLAGEVSEAIGDAASDAAEIVGDAAGELIGNGVSSGLDALGLGWVLPVGAGLLVGGLVLKLLSGNSQSSEDAELPPVITNSEESNYEDVDYAR